MDHSGLVYLNCFCWSIETLSWLTTVRSSRQNPGFGNMCRSRISITSGLPSSS